MTLQLWGRPSSARTQKVILALSELNLSYEFIKASATMGPKGSVSREDSLWRLSTQQNISKKTQTVQYRQSTMKVHPLGVKRYRSVPRNEIQS